MTELEQRLVALRDEVAWPPTPDLAGAVAARVASEPQRRRAPVALRPAWRPVAVAALVAILAGAALLAASPGVRARVADWLGIGVVRVERVERLPAVGPAARLDLGRRTTLAAARRAGPLPVAVPTIAALGEPDAVYVDRRPRTAGVSLVYEPRRGLPRTPPGPGALLTVLAGGDVALVKKLLAAGPSVTAVDVDGAFGVFIAGDHALEPPSRLAGNTVLWERDGVTYRLESALGRDGALRLARSVR
ncbi:MAG: hypothetical protein QOD55_2200 [Solirubrobacteraceae bacterium]|jgi:hypothetical protein|nr:hypothetical protein [Solirubrobacteraceae bacterium]